ncbi:MAG: response regulator [Spirochaetes bacterium]|nr:response regulator [Spirochaetota bacterium]
MKRLLIVDDEPSIRYTVRVLFESEGWEVLEASNGEECLGLVAGGYRGIVLMDIMMPGLDGWDTIRLLAERGLLAGCHVLMLTARETPDAKMEGLQEAVLDYFTKPFDGDALVRAVSQWLDFLPPAPGAVRP